MTPLQRVLWPLLPYAMLNDFATKDSLKIIQITDSHLFSDDSRLFGVNPNKNFDEVIKVFFKKEHPDTDFILLTGDLSQDETPAAYQYLLESFKTCKKPVFWIPGNHDDEQIMETIFTQSSLFNRKRLLKLKHWSLLFINSKLENSGNGYLNPRELNEIKTQVNTSKKNIALIMHHHPIPVNTPLIDRYILNNQDDLWDIISHSKTKLIITGHVHGDYSLVHHGVKIECSPATAYQLKKGTEILQIENTMGYKIHYFERDKHYSKGVVWSAKANL